LPLPKDSQDLISEMITEMNTTNSSRTRSLLQTNIVEFMIKECIEKLFDSKEARNISRGLSVKILLEKGIISNDAKQTISQIFEIRDLYAHKPSLSVADSQAEQIINNMNIVQNELQRDASSSNPRLTNWNQRSVTQKIADVTEFITFGLSAGYETIK